MNGLEDIFEEREHESWVHIRGRRKKGDGRPAIEYWACVAITYVSKGVKSHHTQLQGLQNIFHSMCDLKDVPALKQRGGSNKHDSRYRTGIYILYKSIITRAGELGNP